MYGFSLFFTSKPYKSCVFIWIERSILLSQMWFVMLLQTVQTTFNRNIAINICKKIKWNFHLTFSLTFRNQNKEMYYNIINIQNIQRTFRNNVTISNTTVFSIDKKIYIIILSSKSAYYNDFWRIMSCDTEDWSNDAE